MSHQVNDEHMEVLSAYTNHIIAVRHRFADYVAKYELYGFLTKAEVEFMNEISIACQKLLDTEAIEKGTKSNGNVEQ